MVRVKRHIGYIIRVFLIAIQNVSVEAIQIASEEETSDSDGDNIDTWIKAREKNILGENCIDSGSISSSNLLAEFEKYDQLGRIDKKLKNLEFWNRQRFLFPLLFELAQVALSVPTKQVSV